ncbi:MAG: hypothetical protein ABFD50_00415 [Smithella sp.]
MMEFKVTMDGLKEMYSNITGLSRQVPFATSLALNRTAAQVKQELEKQMPNYMDRPTLYTLRSLKIDVSTMKHPVSGNRKLEATIRYKDKSDAGKGNPASNFMLPQVEGGKRVVKGFEAGLRRVGVLPNDMYIALGAACPIDAYGNIPSSLIVQIMSYFQATRNNITWMSQKRKDKLKKGTKKNIGIDYIVSYGPGTWSGRQHLPAGIYKREYHFGNRTRVRPIMMFVKEPSYKKRFPFYDIAQKIVDQNLKSNFEEAMNEAIRTAK